MKETSIYILILHAIILVIQLGLVYMLLMADRAVAKAAEAQAGVSP